MRIKFDQSALLSQLTTLSAHPRAIQGVTILLVLLLSFSLSQLTWRLWPAPVQRAYVPAAMPMSAASGDAAMKQTDIAALHLFGLRSQTAPVQPEKMPETRLNLVLKGVIDNENGSGSGAIISAPGKDEQFYALQEAVPGGAILKEIFPDHVVLQRNGNLETLRLPRDSLENAEAPPAPGSRNNSFNNRLQSLKQYRDSFMQNPQAFAEALRYTPVPVAGGGVGYLVRPGRDHELFNRVGLHDGDIVTAINGIKLDNQAKLLSAMRIMSGAEQIRLDIQRDGVPQTVVVNLNN